MRQLWVGVLNTAAIADGAALANTASLTDLTVTNADVIPANLLEPGVVIRVTAAGRFSTTATPTLLVGVYYGGIAGVAICTSGALTTASGVTNLTWRFEAVITVRTKGASGTVLGIGELAGVTTAVAKNLAPATAPATATIDTTASKAITIGGQWGTPSASNTITCHQGLVEVIG